MNKEVWDGTNVFINPAERDRQTDQEASIRTRLHGERCPDRDGIWKSAGSLQMDLRKIAAEFGQFYNFLTKDSNPMYNKTQMGIEGNKKQKEGTI